MRTDYYIVIAKNHTAEDILKVLTSIEKLPSRKLFNSLEDLSEYWAGVEKVRLDKLIDDIVSEGVQPVLTGVTIDGNQQEGENTDNVQTISPNALLVYDNMAAFYKNKMVGWLNEEESKGLNYITDEVEGTLIVLEDINDGVVGIELNNSASEIVPHMKGNTPVFDINITGEADVADVNTKINLMSASVFAELTEKANRDIEEKVIAAINKGQKEFKTDIFGFGERLHKSKPKEWEKLKGSWTEIFPTAEVNVNVNIKIRGTGTILEPFHNELED